MVLTPVCSVWAVPGRMVFQSMPISWALAWNIAS